MYLLKSLRAALLPLLLIPVLSGGCASSGSGEPASPDARRATRTEFFLPSADGTVTYGNDAVTLDASHTDDGYVMIFWQGSADKCKIQITLPDQTIYTYTLAAGAGSAFPLTGGDGSYHIEILEHAYDNFYALTFSQDLEVTLKDEFRPFLFPNQFAWYTADSEAVALGGQLSDASADDLDYVQNVYTYVTGHIAYDTDLAASAPSDYVPDADRTLDTGKGICFDYAALMTAMLRSQGIPTRLDVGYSGTAYHAWISVYLEESGWVSGIMEFDGRSWTLMDPTLAASNSSQEVAAYIGDGSHYTVKYLY